MDDEQTLAELLVAVQQGTDQDACARAWTQLVLRCIDDVSAYLRGRMGDRLLCGKDAEFLVVEVFFKLQAYLATTTVNNVRACLRTIARTIYLDCLRQHQRQERGLREFGERQGRSMDGAGSPWEHAVAAETDNFVQEGIRQFSSEERCIWDMLAKGLSHDEIAQRLNEQQASALPRSGRTVRVLVHRLRERVKSWLS